MNQVTIRMPEELSKWIKTKAKKNGISMNALVLNILWKAKEKEGE